MFAHAQSDLFIHSTPDQITAYHESFMMQGVLFFLQALSKQTIQHQPTHEAVTFAFAVIKHASDLFEKADKGGLLQKAAAIAEFLVDKDNILADLSACVTKLRLIEVSDKTVDAWHKLAVWLRALHDNTARLLWDENTHVVPIHADGRYPVLDKGDKMFQVASGGISKYSLIVHYGEAADAIEKRIAQFQPAVTLRDTLHC